MRFLLCLASVLAFSSVAFGDAIGPNQIPLGEASGQAWSVITSNLGIKPQSMMNIHRTQVNAASVVGTISCQQATDGSSAPVCIFTADGRQPSSVKTKH